MRLPPPARALIRALFLLTLVFGQTAAAQSPSPAAPEFQAPTGEQAHDLQAEPTMVEGLAFDNARFEAVQSGKWPAQISGSTGSIQPNRYGPQRNDPSEGIPAHAYSPFDEKRNREHPCPPGGCEYERGHVLVRLDAELTVSESKGATSAEGFSADAGVNGVLASLDIETLSPVFPGARRPKFGAKVIAPDGTSAPMPDLTRWYRATFRTPPDDIYAAVAELSNTPGIAWAEPDYLRKPVGKASDAGLKVAGSRLQVQPATSNLQPDTFDDPLYAQQWHLAATNVPQAWDWLAVQGLPSGGNQDIIVAVIDTGVDYNHPDLAANMWVNAAEFDGAPGVDDDGNGYVDDIHGATTVSNQHTGDPQDDHGHGTHVAGIIAAQAGNGIGGVGVAYNTQLMALKAAQYSGVLSSSDIAEAIYYAVEKGADVINMSFGGYVRSQVEEDALAVAFGTSVLVAAAGNDSAFNAPCGRTMYPAGYNWVLGVMAAIANGSRAAFSNADCVPHDLAEYELMAPGVDIWSTLPNSGYAAWDGTSMAAPLVAGIAALARTYWNDTTSYSSRFIMGQIAGTIQGSGELADAYVALTSSPQPALTYLQHWTFDTTQQAPGNDDDGVVDSGETIDLAISIRNHWGRAYPVIAKLDAWAEGAYQADPYITMITDTVEYGAIGDFAQDDNGLIFDGNGLVTGVSHPFRFGVSADTPNNHVIPFRLTVLSGNGYDPDDPNAPYVIETRFFLVVQRGRVLPSIISTDMTWSASDYWINNRQTLIEAGVTVTITPGTQIQFWTASASNPYADEQNALLEVRGTLNVNGTLESPVEIFPDPLNPRIPVRIYRAESGVVNISYLRMLNPSLNVTGIDHSYFVGNGSYQAYINYLGANISTNTMHYVAAPTVTSSIFRRLGKLGSPNSPGRTQEVFRLAANSTQFAGLAEENLFDHNFYNILIKESTSGGFRNNVLLLNAFPSRDSRLYLAGAPSTECPEGHPVQGNALLNNYFDLAPSNWNRVFYDVSFGPPACMAGTFWGTTSDTLIESTIWDYHDDFHIGEVLYQPIASEAATLAYPFVTRIALASEASANANVAGAEHITFTVTFNRDMDTGIQPAVSFGPAEPYTDHTVPGNWVDARTWKGSFNITPVTGDGYQLIRVAGAIAADDPWLITGDDTGRFRFEIITSGTEAMNLQATGGEGYVDLMWTQDDFDLLAGYNLYRSTSQSGTYTRLNPTIIPPEQKTWRDTNVTPGVPYYYYFKVVKSDMSESGPSNIAEGTPIDTIAPTITHAPITSATYGMGLSIFADVTDNVAVDAVTLFYRLMGTTTYTSAVMAHTTANRYSATIPGAAVVAPGLEYYIEASDGISTARHGTASTPHPVAVTDKPTVTGVTPNQGPVDGGTPVTIAGSNFQAGATVTFGGAAASNVVVGSSSQITCDTPAHYAAVVDVKVTNPSGGAGTLLNGYTYESTATTLGLPDANGGQGASVEIPVNASNVAGLVAASFTVTFDPAVLTPTGATKGNLTPGWTLSTNTSVSGQIRLSMASGGSSVTGSGVLANLQFDVAGAPASSTALSFSNVLLNDGAIPVETDPGSFQVHQVYSVSGATRFWNGGAGVPGATLTLSGDRVYTGSSDATGAYTVGGAAAGNYTLTPAKPDGASEITAYDASLALQHDSGVAALSGYAFKAADVNKTGAVTSMDAHYILQKSVDLIGLPFPGAGVVWDFDPASRSITGLSANLAGQDFTSILLGDPSGNWIAGAGAAGTAVSSALAETGSASLALPEVISAPDVDVTLDLLMGDNTGAVQGVDLTLSYDPAVVDFTGAALGDLPGDWALAQNEITAGTIKLGLAGSTPVANDRVLVRVTFDAIGEKGEASAVTFVRSDLNEGQVVASTSAGEILIDTPPVLDLAASLEGEPGSDAVTLRWSSVGTDADHYEVWRAFGAPYFTPETGGIRIAPNLPATTLSYTDPDGMAAQPGTAVFYFVRSVDADDRPSPAFNRVGIVTFGLQPGVGQ